MRRFEKKAIFDVLDTLEEAHKEYKKYKKEKDMGKCISVLTSCQEAAVSVGNAIEKAEGEGTESVEFLEKYCEDLYQLSQGKKGISLSTDLVNIRNKIRDEIRVVLEVAFFPYKASMWDSMESIYLAFKKIDDVNVYLVPIPYYNRKNNGTVEAMHCESDLFPADEPVTDWKAFDVRKIRPDIAFIHNPYDDMNYVTTVDPRFYSSELKKNVECLVYCPYFSTVGMIPKAQSLCKAYLYADYIIAQSQYQSGFYDEHIPRKKILTMGSPKFDKVIALAKERNENPERFYSRVPREWKERSEGKKVYFYNTSLTGLLGNTELFLDKMEYVFRIFSQNSKRALLWRPHPLIEDTLKAMRPDDYNRYIGIKQYFVDSNIGILDETPDISITVVFCDVFIGSGGTSITSLCAAIGKKMFLLDNTLVDKPTLKDVTDRYFQIPKESYQDGYIITPDNMILKSKTLEQYSLRFQYVNNISDYMVQMYSKCCHYRNEIFILPIHTENILVWNQNGRTSKVDLIHCNDQPYKFFDSFVYNHYIILIPNQYDYIVRIDMDTKEVRYIENLQSIYTSNGCDFDISYCNGCVYNNFLYIVVANNSKILRIDVLTMQYDLISIGEDTDKGYARIQYIPRNDNSNQKNDELILLPYKGMNVKIYYPEIGKVRNYYIKYGDFYCSGQDKENVHDDLTPFSSAIRSGELLFLAPYRGNMFLVLNTNTGVTREWKTSFSLEWQPHNRYFTGGFKGEFIAYNDKYYWQSATLRKLYAIEIHEDKCEIVKEISVNFDVDELKEHFQGFSVESPWWREYGLQEDAVNSLDSFLSGKVYGAPFDQQKELDSFKKVAVNLDGTCGQHVCDFLMKKMEL